jgi:hypothetical protein
MPHAVRKSADAMSSRTVARLVLAALTTVATGLGMPGARHGRAAEAGRPPVSATVEALLLWRDSPAARPLYIRRGADAGVALDSGEIGTGMAAGPRFRIDWSANGTDTIKFNYFNVQSFGGSRSAVSPSTRPTSSASSSRT